MLGTDAETTKQVTAYAVMLVMLLGASTTPTTTTAGASNPNIVAFAPPPQLVARSSPSSSSAFVATGNGACTSRRRHSSPTLMRMTSSTNTNNGEHDRKNPDSFFSSNSSDDEDEDAARRRRLEQYRREEGFLAAPFEEDFRPEAAEQELGQVDDLSASKMISHARQLRMEMERQFTERFAEGDDLVALRECINQISDKIQREGDLSGQLEEKLVEKEQQDPQIMYEVSLDLMEQALREGKSEEALQHEKEANIIRSCLPQYNLEGLWIGKYEDGYEMINVTYVDGGDTLVARKVTTAQNQNVPKGEITFEATLGTRNSNKQRQNVEEDREEAATASFSEDLPPIALTPEATKQWGIKYLPRFHGRGQVAGPNFSNAQFMDGQLVLVGKKYFSFAWVEYGIQIFFGRPSAELTLKMIREQMRQDAEVEEKEEEEEDDELTLVDDVQDIFEYEDDEEQEYYDDEASFRPMSSNIYPTEEEGIFE